MINNSLHNNFNSDELKSQSYENYFNYDHSFKGIDELSIQNEYILFDNTNFTSFDILPPLDSECTPNIKKEYISKLNTIEVKENKKEELILTKKKTKPKKNIEEICTKKLGRKKKDSNETGFHNKYSDDNSIRKLKNKIIKKILDYINSIINDKTKELLNFSPKGLKTSNINYNKELFKRTLKDIFSSEISKKYRRYEVFHNKKIIEEQLLKEKDIKKRNIYETLFNLTFLDCIEHIIGVKKIPVLNELGTLDDIVESLNEDKNYKEFFRNFIMNYESKINAKKGRNKKKNKEI